MSTKMPTPFDDLTSDEVEVLRNHMREVTKATDELEHLRQKAGFCETKLVAGARPPTRAADALAAATAMLDGQSPPAKPIGSPDAISQHELGLALDGLRGMAFRQEVDVNRLWGQYGSTTVASLLEALRRIELQYIEYGKKAHECWAKIACLQGVLGQRRAGSRFLVDGRAWKSFQLPGAASKDLPQLSRATKHLDPAWGGAIVANGEDSQRLTVLMQEELARVFKSEVGAWPFDRDNRGT